MYDFLVTDRRALARRGARATIGARPTRSCCSRRPPDGAGVALYIDPACSRRLEQPDPLGALTEGNLADYCTALEGVSHFVYSTWRLECDAPVSLLELETPGRGGQVRRDGISGGRPAGRRLSRRRCMRGSSTGSTSMRGSSRSNTTATARRTAAPRIFAGVWRAAS